MYRLVPVIALVWSGWFAMASAGEPRAVKLTVAMFAGGTEEDAKVLQQGLEKLPGVKLAEKPVRFGDFRRDGGGFTAFVPLEIADLAKTDVGAMGKTVATAETSHREKAPPALFLIVKYKPDSIKNEPFREALAGVKGVLPAKSWAGDANLWVNIDGSGQARLADITKAMHAAAIKFRDPLTDSSDK